MSELFDRYLDANRMHSFEGDSGVRKFEKLVRDVGGYNDVHEFLADNPGAMNAMVEFVAEWVERNSEWEANLENCLFEEGNG